MYSGDYERSPFLVSQYWFRWWIGDVRQQAVTQTQIDQVPCDNMAAQGANGIFVLCSLIMVWGGSRQVLAPEHGSSGGQKSKMSQPTLRHTLLHYTYFWGEYYWNDEYGRFIVSGKLISSGLFSIINNNVAMYHHKPDWWYDEDFSCKSCVLTSWLRLTWIYFKAQCSQHMSTPNNLGLCIKTVLSLSQCQKYENHSSSITVFIQTPSIFQLPESQLRYFVQQN